MTIPQNKPPYADPNYPRMGPLPDHLKPDPYIKCMNACDKIDQEIFLLACRIFCFFAK